MTEPSGETVVADPPWVRTLLWLGFPLLGLAVGGLIPRLADWANSRGLPLPGPLRLLTTLPEPQITIGAIVLGAGAGLALAHLAVRDLLAVTVGPDQVRLQRGDATQELPRTGISAVFLDGKRLVFLGPSGAELANEGCDLEPPELAEAFTGHGYPWRADGDPYRDAYRRWVPDLPELPAGVDALFKARQKAMDKGDRDDAAELRGELAKLGFVVRDEDKRQHWRRTIEVSDDGPGSQGNP